MINFMPPYPQDYSDNKETQFPIEIPTPVLGRLATPSAAVATTPMTVNIHHGVLRDIFLGHPADKNQNLPLSAPVYFHHRDVPMSNLS